MTLPGTDATKGANPAELAVVGQARVHPALLRRSLAMAQRLLDTQGLPKVGPRRATEAVLSGSGARSAARYRASGPRPLPWSLMSPSSESVLIDAARHLRRWSAAELARESGLAMGTIQEALSGRRGRGSSGIDVRPSVGTLLVLARTLELSPEQFRRCGREDAAIALELLGEEFDLSPVPIAALVSELTKRTGGPEKGSWTWVPRSSDVSS